MAQALADLEELHRLATANNLELGVELQRLADEGLPVLCIDWDSSTTVSAKGGRCVYKLPERLQAFFSALRARERDSNPIASIGHGNPSEIAA